MNLVFILFILVPLHSLVEADSKGDADVLYDMKLRLSATDAQLLDWDQNSVNPCFWKSVICDGENNVIQVILPFMGFTGTLSPRIGELTYLNVLSLRGNKLTGRIPEQFGKLSSLTSLILEDNHLTGQIPSSLGKLAYLQILILSQNKLNGSIPDSLSNLSSLNDMSLRDNKLTGRIPEQFGNLSSLTSLILEDNHLTGQIPSSLGKLAKLRILFLSQNKLNGNIPDSLSNLSSLNDIRLAFNDLTGKIPDQLFQVATYIFTGNSLDCGTNFPLPCASSISNFGGSHSSKVGVVLGSIGGVLVILVTGCLFLHCRNRKHLYKRKVFVDVAGEDDRRIALGQLKRFAWRELQIATNSFSEKNVLGKGGFGKVYKGVLSDKTKIAVKRLTDYESPGGEASFLREIELISVAVHRNLLRLIGFCTTPSERLLVYPFMQNLSVAYCLRDFKPAELVLDWPKRKRIALGTACGLEYLHEHCNPKIIHWDVKAANILLDEDFEAVVGDFGLAKLVDIKKTSVTTQVRGTMGHIAPEYLSTGKSSERTDIFGYGIMLLELVTGQRAIDFSRMDEEDDVLFLGHVKKLERERRLDALVDCNLNKKYDNAEVEKVIQVALLCTQKSPEERPTMSEVVWMLEGEGLAERWEAWQQVEVTRRREYERLQRGFKWGDDSVYNLDAIELSGGR